MSFALEKVRVRSFGSGGKVRARDLRFMWSFRKEGGRRLDPLGVC